jgi:putative ABC transport system permease protein
MPLMLMVICTFLLAIPLGYLLSWLLIHQLNVLAFGWTMELQWSWLPVVTLLLMSVGMVITTLLMALIKTRRELSGSIRRLSGGNG